MSDTVTVNVTQQVTTAAVTVSQAKDAYQLKLDLLRAAGTAEEDLPTLAEWEASLQGPPGPGAGTPTVITVADEHADTSCFPAFFTGATGYLGPKTASSLTFNSHTGDLGATLINGLTITANGTNTLNIAAGQTLTVTTGGTLGSAAYTASGDYATAAQGGKADTALQSLSGALLATGATTGATSQAQAFTNGITLSGLSTWNTGTTFSYADATAKNAHRTAMGVGIDDNPSLAGVVSSGTISVGKSVLYNAFNNAQLWLSPASSTTGLSLGYSTASSTDYAFIQAVNVGSGYKNISINRDGGNVGIGTATIGATLTVAGTATISSTLGVTGATTCTGLLTANGGIQSGTGAGEIDVVSTNGALLGIRTVEASVNTTSGATVTATALIPAGSYVLGVTARVTTLMTGATSFSIGDGTDADAWGTGILPALNTTTSSANFNITAPAFYAAATNVVLTSADGDFTAGAVRLAVHYMQLTGPTG